MPGQSTQKKKEEKLINSKAMFGWKKGFKQKYFIFISKDKNAYVRKNYLKMSNLIHFER